MTAIRYYAGLGCRRGCDVTELHELLQSALQTQGLSSDQLTALATLDTKRDEAGLQALAQRLGLPLLFFNAEQLAGFEWRLLTPSAVALRETGTAGVAEASALAAAGANGELLGPKCKSAAATCALARASIDS